MCVCGTPVTVPCLKLQPKVELQSTVDLGDLKVALAGGKPGGGWEKIARMEKNCVPPPPTLQGLPAQKKL